MAGMYCMEDLLELVLREGAEELRLRDDKPPALLLKGESMPIDLPAASSDELSELLQSIATADQLKELQACGDVRFIYHFQTSARFAVNASKKRDTVEVTIRNLNRLGA